MLYLEFMFLLVMLYLGSRYGGIGLGVVSGIGLVVEVFIFRMPPTSPPVTVMLIILAVVTCASILEAPVVLNTCYKWPRESLEKIQKMSH